MTGFLIFWAIVVIAITGIALALPCEGCRLRRERLRRTLETWKSRRSS